MWTRIRISLANWGFNKLAVISVTGSFVKAGLAHALVSIVTHTLERVFGVRTCRVGRTFMRTILTLIAVEKLTTGQGIDAISVTATVAHADHILASVTFEQFVGRNACRFGRTRTRILVTSGFVLHKYTVLLRSSVFTIFSTSTGFAYAFEPFISLTNKTAGLVCA